MKKKRNMKISGVKYKIIRKKNIKNLVKRINE